MAVSTTIRKDRLQRQLTQADFTACGGKRRVTLTRDEWGRVDMPRSALGEIARALKVPVRKLRGSHGNDDGGPSQVRRSGRCSRVGGRL
jgi:hypothetical protein